MIDQTSLREITNHISKAETEKAIGALKSLINDFLSKSPGNTDLNKAYELLIIKSAEYYDLNNRIRANFLNKEVSSSALNLVNKGLLDVVSILSDIEPEVIIKDIPYGSKLKNIEEQEELIQIEITIDLPFEKYDQDSIKEIIAKTIQLKGNIKITNIRKGSIKVTLKIPKRDVIPLVEAINQEKLKSFKIKSATIIISKNSDWEYIKLNYPYYIKSHPHIFLDLTTNEILSKRKKYLLATFDALRSIKRQLPFGSIKFIANQLEYSEQKVRNYFGARKYEEDNIPDIHFQTGPEGGVYYIGESKVLNITYKLLTYRSREKRKEFTFNIY